MNREAGFLTVARWTLLDVDHETVPGSFWHILMALNVFCGLVPSDNKCYPTRGMTPKILYRWTS